MRHLWSFLAGLVVAPLTWVLVTLGQDGSTRTIDRWMEIDSSSSANLIEPAVYLGLAGVLLGLLGTLRVSPFGPLVAGLLLVVPYLGMFVAPFSVRDGIPDGWKVLGDQLPLHLPVENGTLFLVGALLLMAVFSGQRWRQWPCAYSTDSTDGPTEGALPLADWSPSAEPTDRDIAPASLGYPDPTPAEPLPRRTGDSPWSAPPRTGPQRDSTSR